MDEVFSQAADVLEEQTDDAVLLCAPGGAVLRLAGTAVDIWQAWATPAGTDAVVAALGRKYRSDPDRLHSDVVRIRDLLRDHALLTKR